MTEVDIPAAMEKAADLILQDGKFGKGKFRTADGCVCTLGAYAVGLGIPFDGCGLMEFGGELMAPFDEGWEYLNDTVKAYGFGFVQSMNDADETTAAEMADVLRETAARLRAEPARSESLATDETRSAG
jgi:hypothetical protein